MVMRLVASAVVVSTAMASPALAQRIPFERSFDITGPATLDASTVRGRLAVQAGPADRIVVVGTGTVRMGWDVPADAADVARRIADNPPVERDGDTVRLRPPSDSRDRRAVTVSYEVRVAPQARVVTVSDSGAPTVTGVSGAGDVTTQSGAIELTRLGSTVMVKSGSGSVTVS